MSRRRTLRPEEQEIWQSVARTAKPMHRTHPIALPESAPKLVIPAVEAPQKLPAFRLGQSVKSTSSAQFAPGIGESLAKAPLRMDAKTHSKMTRGKLAPEARIDLHGMTVDQAHPALISFILSAQSAGMRLVLVITGKGKSRAEFGPMPQRMGVLRTQVPHWLHLPPLNFAVMQVTEAHASHGGGGALYVYLRRR